MKDDAITKPPFEQLNPGAWRDETTRARRQLSGQITANVFLSAVCLVLTALLIYLAFYRQPKPYVLEVDQAGNVSFSGFIEKGDVSDGKYIPSQVMAFIENWRTVTPDNTMQKRNIQRLYCMIPKKAPAYLKMNTYFKTAGNDPWDKNENLSVATKMRSISKLSGKTWQVEWYETERLHDGSIVGPPLQQKATMIIEQRAVDTDCIEGNPLGVYVMDLDWTSVQ